MPIFGSRWNPKGPDLTDLKEHQFILSGIKIKLKSPVSNDPVHKGGELKLSPNLYDRESFGAGDDPCRPLKLGLLGRNWIYKGLPFIDSGRLGEIRMGVSIAYMPLFGSLFRPRRFECAVERYICLTDLYTSEGYSRLDYNFQIINGVDWANYICRSDKDKNSEFQTIWQAPISDVHLITVRFTQSGKLENANLRRAYSQLIDAIINSLTIELPKDILSAKEKVQKTFSYESFPASLPPYIFERYNALDEYDVVDKVAASYNFETSHIPKEVFNKQVDDEVAAEKQKQQAVHQQVLNDHMRFDALEKADYQRYLAAKKAG